MNSKIELSNCGNLINVFATCFNIECPEYIYHNLFYFKYYKCVLC